MPPEPPPTVLHHGTTLQRARAIEKDGPDPDYREPGSRSLLGAGGFSTVIGDGRPCGTGTPEQAARGKDALFPNEGGPAILEVIVPESIMAILYADPLAAGLAQSGEIRFEPVGRVAGRLAQPDQTDHRAVSAENIILDFLRAPLGPNWTVEGLAEQILGAIAAQSDDAGDVALDADAITDRQAQRLVRPLLACIATMSAAEAGTSANLYGGPLVFERPSSHGSVWIVGQFENRPGNVRVTLRRSKTAEALRANGDATCSERVPTPSAPASQKS